MKNCIITFRSVTPAQRAEDVLRRAGVECTIQRTPRWMEEKGCGYSLRMPCGDMLVAASLLRNAGVSFRSAYSLGEEGRVEELRL
ncbi:MAG: DUF3343 domain-containing protein [Oscillospiraceae bacterium]|nr:DUF3343 domain-containing protein [Oscillospiraceae bacterium]